MSALFSHTGRIQHVHDLGMPTMAFFGCVVVFVGIVIVACSFKSSRSR